MPKPNHNPDDPQRLAAHTDALLGAGVGLYLAAHAVDLTAGELPEWIYCLPAGHFSGHDGRGPYLNDRPQTLLEFHAANGIDLPLDYDHQSLTADAKQDPVPASGFGKALELREGVVWARGEWTDQAAAALKAKEYRYFSPAFLHDKQGHIRALVGGGLTNNPNLHLEAVAHRLGFTANSTAHAESEPKKTAEAGIFFSCARQPLLQGAVGVQPGEKHVDPDKGEQGDEQGR